MIETKTKRELTIEQKRQIMVAFPNLRCYDAEDSFLLQCDDVTAEITAVYVTKKKPFRRSITGRREKK